MIFKVGDVVLYNGEYKNCHGHRYKIVKQYPGGWFDLEILNPVGIYEPAYNNLLSVEIQYLELSIVDCNVLIAKFMGWKIDNSFPDKNRIWKSPGGNTELDTTMKFHKNWNWLMPVVKKLHQNNASITCELNGDIVLVYCFVYMTIRDMC